MVRTAQHPLSCRGSLHLEGQRRHHGSPTDATPSRRRLPRPLRRRPHDSTAPTLTDSATLSGGVNPTGTITFYLFAPGVTPNATDSNNVYSDAVTVSGNGSYSTSTGTNPGGYTPTASGTYQWVAVYSGDGNNSSTTGTFRQRDGAVGNAVDHHDPEPDDRAARHGANLTQRRRCPAR